MTGPNIFGLREYSRKDLFECTTDEIREADRFYIMHEADNVIMEKDTKIIQLEALIENYNRISREIIDNANHQKYKRCLNQAKLCERLCFEFKDLFYSTSNEELEHAYNRRIEHYFKWNNRWLKIAEQFKEAK